MIHQYHAGGRAKWHWRKVNDEWGGKQTQHCLERGSIGGGHSLVAVGCERNRAFLSIHLPLVFFIIHQVHAVGAEKHIKGSKRSPPNPSSTPSSIDYRPLNHLPLNHLSFHLLTSAIFPPPSSVHHLLLHQLPALHPPTFRTSTFNQPTFHSRQSLPLPDNGLLVDEDFPLDQSFESERSVPRTQEP